MSPEAVPVVSVVIPTHNRGSVLTRAIQSVVAQTFQDFEVLIVDDDSSDDTPRLVADLAATDARIHHHRHESNRGAQAARNTGIRAARGEWVAFLDSDDWWLPSSLEVRLGLAVERDVRVVHSECYMLREGSEMKLSGVRPMAGSVYRSLLSHPGPMFPGMLVARLALERIGFLDERIVSYQEWDTAIRLAKHYRFGFVEEPTFAYDCRGGDTISKDMLRDAAGWEQTVRKHSWPMLLNLGPKALSIHYRDAASRYHRACDERGARRSMLMSRLCWPIPGQSVLQRLRRVPRGT
jgi:glycosyltransferase involved in cell wall biosynthesis